MLYRPVSEPMSWKEQLYKNTGSSRINLGDGFLRIFTVAFDTLF